MHDYHSYNKKPNADLESLLCCGGHSADMVWVHLSL